MPDAWISVPFTAVVWVISAIISIATLETAYLGIIGILAWAVFLGGIIAFFLKIFSN
jgi:hypothetical protein